MILIDVTLLNADDVVICVLFCHIKRGDAPHLLCTIQGARNEILPPIANTPPVGGKEILKEQ